MLLDALGPRTSELDNVTGWTFLELFHHPEHETIFTENKDFRITGQNLFRSATSNFINNSKPKFQHFRLGIASPRLREKNKLVWDGRLPILEYIDTLWARTKSEGYIWQSMAMRPKFYQIRYSLTTPRKFSEFRSLNFRVPNADKTDEKWKFYAWE